MQVLEQILKEIDKKIDKVSAGEACGLYIAKDIIHSNMVDDDRHANMTAEEAWEIARKIIASIGDGGYSQGELRKIFGTGDYGRIIGGNSPQEAKAKIESWKAGKEIKSGDVVESEDHTKAVVLDVHGDVVDVFTDDGHSEEWYKSKVTKTVHHIDVRGLLEQLLEIE